MVIASPGWCSLMDLAGPSILARRGHPSQHQPKCRPRIPTKRHPGITATFRICGKQRSANQLAKQPGRKFMKLLLLKGRYFGKLLWIDKRQLVFTSLTSHRHTLQINFIFSVSSADSRNREPNSLTGNTTLPAALIWISALQYESQYPCPWPSRPQCHPLR